MRLRSRILIITFLIILFVQGLNCFLEIGFLANNLEKNNLRKYRITGTELKRKLDKSLIFGKSLANLNFNRLLGNIIPDDIKNLYIIDTQGHVVFSHNQADYSETLHMHIDFFQEKTQDTFRLFIPLSDRKEIKGNLVIVVSQDEIKGKMLYLIRQSISNFLIIVALSLPVLYGLLTLFIVRPYNRFIQESISQMDNRDYEGLTRKGINLFPLLTADKTLLKLKQNQWLSPENRCIYDHLDEPGNESDPKDFEKKLHNELTPFMNTH
ncbi:MAG: hypothetical protein MI892_21605 [Desulfobacterales bacterium]|nr:hypothetical protein [Desulfobacterales bacterium]